MEKVSKQLSEAISSKQPEENSQTERREVKSFPTAFIFSDIIHAKAPSTMDSARAAVYLGVFILALSVVCHGQGSLDNRLSAHEEQLVTRDLVRP